MQRQHDRRREPDPAPPIGDGDREHDQHEAGDIEGPAVIIEDAVQQIELAQRIGVDDPSGRGILQHQRQRRQKGRAADDQIAQGRDRPLALQPDLTELVRGDHHGIHAEGEKMREIDRERENRAEREPQQPVPPAERDPSGECRQRQAAAEEKAHEAPEQEPRVEQQEGKQRPERPVPEQDTVYRRGATGEQQESERDEELSRPFERHHLRERGHDAVHGEIGDRRPLDDVIAREPGIGQVRQQMHAREMVGIVEQRRQRRQQQRQAARHEEDREGEREAAR